MFEITNDNTIIAGLLILGLVCVIFLVLLLPPKLSKLLLLVGKILTVGLVASSIAAVLFILLYPHVWGFSNLIAERASMDTLFAWDMLVLCFAIPIVLFVHLFRESRKSSRRKATH